jgi:hypothetical protein
MTSAAIPDFHAKPRLVRAELMKAGNIKGNLILKKI